MRLLRANIPSEKEYFVNENGIIFNHFEKPLKGKPNPNSQTLRALDFLNLNKKRQSMSFQKIVWNTFNPSDLAQDDEIIKLKDPNNVFPFAISNLEKVTKSENVKAVNKIRLDRVRERELKKESK